MKENFLCSCAYQELGLGDFSTIITLPSARILLIISRNYLVTKRIYLGYILKGTSNERLQENGHENVVLLNRTPDKIRDVGNLKFPIADQHALQQTLAAITKVPNSDGALYHYINDNRNKVVSTVLS